jgi:hypothetical protein
MRLAEIYTRFSRMDTCDQKQRPHIQHERHTPNENCANQALGAGRVFALCRDVAAQHFSALSYVY